MGRPPASALYQNRIKTLSETAIGVVCRAKSRFPRLLERLRKRETEWTVWNGTSRAQGRCATRLRYAPTDAAVSIISSGREFRVRVVVCPIYFSTGAPLACHSDIEPSYMLTS